MGIADRAFDFRGNCQKVDFRGIAAISDERMRADSDKLLRVLRRQTPTEDARHLRRVATRRSPRRVAPQPPQATSDRMTRRSQRCLRKSAHPTEACAGGFQGMAPVSDACWWRRIASVPLTVRGETESSSNGVDLVSGMALATGVGPSTHWKTPAASAVPHSSSLKSTPFESSSAEVST